jgi:predicted metalloprotease
MAVGGGGIGILVIAAIAMFLGADPEQVQQIVQQQAQPPAANQQVRPIDDEAGEFISVVLRDTEEVWKQLFEQNVRGGAYREPKLVIFSENVQSGCGKAHASMGPFYCPADQQIYIDPVFFDDLKRRHNAPGDFAQAYVIAHEVAHHVQTLLGLSRPVNEIRQQGNELATNRATVRLELQADFLSGVWAHHAHKNFDILEEGDLEEAINAANQIGDDTLQRKAMGYVVPDRFTHGTSAQRVRWFKAGLVSGDLNKCQQLFDLDYDEL